MWREEYAYSPLVKYDVEKLKVSIVKFCIICEFPSRLVEHKGFINYVADYLEPL